MARVLIVEDDRLLRKAIADEIKEAGYEVEVVGTGEEALEVAKNNDVGLIYLDIMLASSMDGYEVLRQLKASEDARVGQIPVIMLSNLGQLDEIERAMDAGATDYIVKATIDLPRLVEITKEKLPKI